MNNLMSLSKLSIAEFQNNSRLRWMLLAVLVLVFFSMSAWFSSLVTELRNDTAATINFSSRLQRLSDEDIDATKLERVKEEVDQQILLFPTARSESVAEALALKELEDIFGSLIYKKRLNLLGSERLNTDNSLFWQVRLEVNGQLQSENLVDLLSYFDTTQVHRRLNALRYQLNRSNNVNLVVDVLYLGVRDE